MQSNLLSTYWTMKEFKVFNDSVHGHISLHPLCVDIIDTLHFQRLRNIKQCGSLYFVYPGSCHNRFEHSLGTCFLGGELVTSLRNRQPELNITNNDVLCVTIAGLCHDLGHGAFSHTWEKFVRTLIPDSAWKHEIASIKMFDYMLSENGLKKKFLKYGLKEEDIVFIKDLILGQSQSSDSELGNGRTPDKNFLFEIVSNKRNGVDVDKWDYLLRDCHNFGMRCNFDYTRFILFARVIDVEGEGPQICMRDKEAENVYYMFHTRWALHRRAFKHKVSCIIDQMILDAFNLADEHMLFDGTNGSMTMSEATDNYDMKAFGKITDYIFYQILYSCDPKLTDSKKILENVQRRILYAYIGQTILPSAEIYSQSSTIETELTTIMDEMKHFEQFKNCNVMGEDIMALILYFDYGMKGENPIDKIRFYSKSDPFSATNIKKDDLSKMLPEKFEEVIVRVICKKRDSVACQLVGLCFEKWCYKRGYPSPLDCK